MPISTDPGSLLDYLGIPSVTGTFGPISAMPLAAYQKIWYDNYRDQNFDVYDSPTAQTAYSALFDPGKFPLSDGDNSANWQILTSINFRAWKRDYFTSALPWTQRGPEATIPLGVDADLQGTGALNYEFGTAGSIARQTANGDPNLGLADAVSSETDARLDSKGQQIDIDVTPHTFLDLTATNVDLSSATAATINDLRRAFRLQEWLEKMARGGSRYNEQIKAHFNVNIGDARLNRPEFLGGSVHPIVISEVLQTSSNADEPTPQGNMAGHGVAVGSKNLVSYFCKEHGFIIGICSLLPKPSYAQGMERFWRKFDRFDYAWPTFANIGEQPIFNYEIYLTAIGDAYEQEATFGYTPRYAEYKFKNSTFHGEFRDTLSFWHAGRIFASGPVLSQQFNLFGPGGSDIDRVFAVNPDITDPILVQMFHQIKATRPLPFFGTPRGV